MMETITLVFTKRKWNIGSYIIRWGLPKTRFKVAEASHCMIKDGDYYIEATMAHGVRRSKASTALDGQTVVEEITFEVKDAQAGLEFARSQVGKSYDFKGAFGLSLAPDRVWKDDDKWFCFELGAATLSAAGRQAFREDAVHISGNLLMALKPQF